MPKGTDADRLPVVAGVAQVLQRQDDPGRAAEPLELMFEALVGAGADAGAPKLLSEAQALYVLRGAWGYGDPGRVLARRLGAASAETVGTPYGGHYAQLCVLDAARRIAAGDLRVALVTGGEIGRTAGRAARAGVTLRESPAPGAPDRRIAEDAPIFHEAELARDMNSASDVFAVIGSALRAARGESLDANRARIARLWARFAEVARDNPHAWIREAPDPETIATPSPANPMISFPYTRLENANARVDMAAGILVCSLAAARAAGISEDRLVHLRAGVVIHDTEMLSERLELHRAPALALAGARLAELAGAELRELEHIDLYSCFPSAVEVAAAELGLSEERPLTVTGGLTFGGGPLNSYGLHAVARMVERLREDRRARGLVHGNGGWLAKHALAVYAAGPGPEGFRFEDLRPRARELPRREALTDFEGEARVEGYTVAHRGGAPERLIAACLTPDGRRTWAVGREPSLLERGMSGELCGTGVRIGGGGALVA